MRMIEWVKKAGLRSRR